MLDPSDSEIVILFVAQHCPLFLAVLTTHSIKFGGTPLCPEEPPSRLNIQGITIARPCALSDIRVKEVGYFRAHFKSSCVM